MVLLTSIVVQLAIAVIVSAQDNGRCAGRMCPAVYDPVCASDKRTYSNKCRFAIAKCEVEAAGNKEALTIVNKGKCSDKNVEVCNGVCPEIYAPLCGSDNTTYSNLCTFQIAQCNAKLNGTRLTVVKKGRCEDIDRTRETRCPKACIKIYRPVCASNGKTFGNGCELEIAQCENMKRGGPALTKVNNGRCKAPMDTCRKPCNKMLRPVCASNGRTFGNDCMLRNAACMARRNGQVLTMVSEGRCAVKKPEENMANTCMRPCPRIYRPVCGSNRRTYSNSCELSIAACRSRQAGGQQLTVMKQGSC